MELTFKSLKGYSSLQQRLLFSLFNSIGKTLSQSNFRSDLPITGFVMSNSEKWTYRRHGNGVFFTDGILEVDAVKHIFTDLSGFDAWRLKVYFESMGNTHSERSIDKLLQNYAKKGCLYKYPFKDLYVLNIGCFKIDKDW